MGGLRLLGSLGGVLALASSTSVLDTEDWVVREIGRSVEGRPILCHTLGQRPFVLLLGGVHGNEPQGAYCARQVLSCRGEILGRLEGHSLAVVPCLNPDGLHRRTRGNARGVDLNRNLPSANWSPTGAAPYRPGPEGGSEPETRALLSLLETLRPERIVSLHAPLRLVNVDGARDGVGEAMAGATGYPPAEEIGYPTPGSLGSWAGVDRGIPVITLEMPESPSRACWGECREAILLGVTTALRGESPWADEAEGDEGGE